jgi:MoaA/NifB/PqqE/SkfB family radical SAM enzyme
MREEFDLPAGLVRFQVSLDGIGANHDAIRGSGVYDKAIGFLNAKQSAGYKVHTMTVIDTPNWDDIQAIIDLGFDANFQLVSRVGRAESYDKLPENEFDEIVKRIGLMGGKCRGRVKCCRSTLTRGSRVAIDNEGYIIPCPYLRTNRYGTIEEFDEIRVRKEMLYTIATKSCTYPDGYK